MINQAIQFAKEKHKGQIRTFTKKPFVEHPLNVMEIINTNKKTNKQEELFVAAVLHDTLEETKTTESELENKFGKTVLTLVKELTIDEEERKKEGKTKYLADKMSNPNKMSAWGLIIKLADRLDNLSDLSQQTKEFKDKYIKQTKSILKELKNKRTLSPTQTILVKKIEEKLK